MNLNIDFVVKDTQDKLVKMSPGVFRAFKRYLCLEYSECFESLGDDSDPQSVFGQMMECFSEEDALKVVFYFLNKGMFLSFSVSGLAKIIY